MSASLRTPWVVVTAALVALFGCSSPGERPLVTDGDVLVGLASLSSVSRVTVRVTSAADVLLGWQIAPPRAVDRRELERLARDPRRVRVEIVTHHVGDVPLARADERFAWSDVAGWALLARTYYPAPLHIGRDDIRMVLLTIDGASYRFPVP